LDFKQRLENFFVLVALTLCEVYWHSTALCRSHTITCLKPKPLVFKKCWPILPLIQRKPRFNLWLFSFPVAQPLHVPRLQT
jgi:hypothetical protein